MRAILTAVDYADVLSVTLPRMRPHFSELWVVTTPTDHATIALAYEHRCCVVVTKLFHEDGAEFNKWRALEYGLERMGRTGLLAIIDADVIWPEHAPLMVPKGYLCTPRRRILEDLSQPIPPESEWRNLPLHPQDQEHAGYSQIFHADDPTLGVPPWHQIDYRTAGTADSFFQAKWPAERKIRPPWDCLHLGPSGVNWAGRVMPYRDGSVPEGAAQRQETLRELFRQRRGKVGMERFAHEKLPPGTV